MISTRCNRLYAPLVLCFLSCLSGCVTPKESDLYCDNTTGDVLIFYVDGIAVAKVPPNDFRKVSVKLGEHVLSVKNSDGKVIFKEKQTLSEPKGMVRDRYVLNPDLESRYCTLTFIYGNDTASQAASDAMVKTIAWLADKEIDQSDETMMEFVRLRRDAVPMETGGWFRVPAASRVLEPLPSFVVSRNASERRTTLIRIPDEAHRYLVEAEKQTNANSADVAMMENMLLLLEELVEVE